MNVEQVVGKGIGRLENREGRRFTSLCRHTEFLTDDNKLKVSLSSRPNKDKPAPISTNSLRSK